MNNKKNKILLYVCIAIFGIFGVYLTFISGNTKKFDSYARAYDINPNEHYDSDSGTTYQPIYYFKVGGKEYECKSKIGSSSYPNENKNIVYYDSSNPTKCKTEYEKSSSKLGGIICLVVTAVIIYFFIIRKPIQKEEDNNENFNNNREIDQEQVEKVIGIVGKVQLIYKRVIIGIIIMVLLVFILIDTVLFKQTLKSRDYLETIATNVDKKEDGDSSSFDDYIYTFTDNQGNEQKITISYSKNESSIKQEIKLKYNKNNPQDFYEEGSTLDKAGIIWYFIKIVLLVLLVILFFNKKLLSKIGISITNTKE